MAKTFAILKAVWRLKSGPTKTLLTKHGWPIQGPSLKCFPAPTALTPKFPIEDFCLQPGLEWKFLLRRTWSGQQLLSLQFPQHTPLGKGTQVSLVCWSQQTPGKSTKPKLIHHNDRRGRDHRMYSGLSPQKKHKQANPSPCAFRRSSVNFSIFCRDIYIYICCRVNNLATISQ